MNDKNNYELVFPNEAKKEFYDFVTEYIECGGLPNGDYQGVLEAIEKKTKIDYETLNNLFQEELKNRESQIKATCQKEKFFSKNDCDRLYEVEEYLAMLKESEIAPRFCWIVSNIRSRINDYIIEKKPVDIIRDEINNRKSDIHSKEDLEKVMTEVCSKHNYHVQFFLEDDQCLNNYGDADLEVFINENGFSFDTNEAVEIEKE